MTIIESSCDRKERQSLADRRTESPYTNNRESIYHLNNHLLDINKAKQSKTKLKRKRQETAMGFLPCCCLVTHDMKIGAFVRFILFTCCHTATTMYPKRMCHFSNVCVNKCPMVKGSFRRCDDDRFIPNFGPIFF